METVFMVYNLVCIMKMTVYTIWLVLSQGARQRHFILWFRVDVVNLKHSVRYEESLVVSLFEKPKFTKSHCICRYLDL